MKKLILFILTLTFIFYSCSSSEKNEDQRTIQKSEDQIKITEKADNTSQTAIVIKNLNTKEEFKLSEYKIKAKNFTIKKEGNKYKISGDINKTIKIKYKDDNKIKLYDEYKTLLWKIKIDKSGKIKISDNEENKNPFFIKQSKPDFAKIKYQEEEIVHIKLTEKGLIVKKPTGEKLFKVKVNRMMPSVGLLAIEKIPTEEALIIISELNKRGY